MGPPSAWRIAEGDWTGILFSGCSARRHSSQAPAAFATGADVCGAGGDLPTGCGNSALRVMARLLGHAPSTVSREVRRNGGYDRYRAEVALHLNTLRALLKSRRSADRAKRARLGRSALSRV